MTDKPCEESIKVYDNHFFCVLTLWHYGPHKTTFLWMDNTDVIFTWEFIND